MTPEAAADLLNTLEEVLICLLFARQGLEKIDDEWRSSDQPAMDDFDDEIVRLLSEAGLLEIAGNKAMISAMGEAAVQEYERENSVDFFLRPSDGALH